MKAQLLFFFFETFPTRTIEWLKFLTCNQLLKQKGMFYMDFSIALNSVRGTAVCSLLPPEAGALCHDNICITWRTHTADSYGNIKY